MGRAIDRLRWRVFTGKLVARVKMGQALNTIDGALQKILMAGEKRLKLTSQCADTAANLPNSKSRTG